MSALHDRGFIVQDGLWRDKVVCTLLQTVSSEWAIMLEFSSGTLDLLFWGSSRFRVRRSLF